MTKRKFKNRPNERISVRYLKNDGTSSYIDAWISRSPAVVGVVFFNSFVLLVERSINMYTEPGKICAPCGYIDWNETAYEAMVREVYEETSIYLPDYKDKLFFNNNEEPFFVETRPDEDKNQNISLMFVSYYDIDMNNLPDIINYSNSETNSVFFVNMSDLDNVVDKGRWAFNHNRVIKDALNYISKK